jgi:hypothetical protein
LVATGAVPRTGPEIRTDGAIILDRVIARCREQALPAGVVRAARAV